MFLAMAKSLSLGLLGFSLEKNIRFQGQQGYKYLRLDKRKTNKLDGNRENVFFLNPVLMIQWLLQHRDRVTRPATQLKH